MQHRRSPLIRGGLEIPIEVRVAMANSDENAQAIHKYIDLVNDHYEEPVGEKFRDYTDSIRTELGEDKDIVSDSSSDESEYSEQ